MTKAKHLPALHRQELHWSVYTPGLLREISNNPGTEILQIPLKVFAGLLMEVGQRALTLNDPKLNVLMLRLALYTMADPASADYDGEAVRKYIREVEGS